MGVVYRMNEGAQVKRGKEGFLRGVRGLGWVGLGEWRRWRKRRRRRDFHGLA